MGRYADMLDPGSPLSFPTITHIQRVVAARFDIAVADLIGRRRFQPLALRRQVAMYLCLQMTNRSMAMVGRSFGGRDRSTVHFAAVRVADIVEQDEAFAAIIDGLRQKISETMPPPRETKYDDADDAKMRQRAIDHAKAFVEAVSRGK